MAKKRIMVVEDEGIAAMRILSSLEEMGHSVTSTVFSGEEAVKKAAEDKPDLVLMDIVLRGEKDGIDAAGHIRSRFNIPVVYVTAHSDEKMLKRIKKTEPFGYIVKPIDERELHIAVELALYKNSMEQKLKEKEKELRRHRNELMHLVEERTSELQRSNERLAIEILERKQAEAEALRASQLASLGELSAGIAHEINNPINGVINYAQIIFNKSKEESNEKILAGQIIKESDRIAGIVKNLLFFARNGKEQKYPVKIHEIMSESLALTKAQLRKDGIKLKVNMTPDLPAITAHPQQIEQVFLNIISNARYALNQKCPGSDSDKLIEIAAEETTVEECTYIRITFFDNGAGISADILDKILNPFFSTKPFNHGTGLGLSISHGIISDHGGRLAVNSVGGEYTKVIIELPLS